jgi:hypothetical protein
VNHFGRLCLETNDTRESLAEELAFRGYRLLRLIDAGFTSVSPKLAPIGGERRRPFVRSGESPTD